MSWAWRAWSPHPADDPCALASPSLGIPDISTGYKLQIAKARTVEAVANLGKF